MSIMIRRLRLRVVVLTLGRLTWVLWSWGVEGEAAVPMGGRGEDHLWGCLAAVEESFILDHLQAALEKTILPPGWSNYQPPAASC